MGRRIDQACTAAGHWQDADPIAEEVRNIRKISVLILLSSGYPNQQRLLCIGREVPVPAEILVIEDDVKMGELLVCELGKAGYRVRWAVDARSGLRRFAEQPADLILLDLVLPDQLGFVVLAEIRRTSDVPVILLTGRNLVSEKVLGFDLGADDYDTKPFWMEELLARIAIRLRPRKVSVDKPIRHIGDLEVDMEGHRVFVERQPVALTPTEFAILGFLAQRPGRAIRREELYDLLPKDGDTPEAALNIHMHRLRRKLGHWGDRIGTVWGIGYRLEADAVA